MKTLHHLSVLLLYISRLLQVSMFLIPQKDLKYFIKVDSALSLLYPDYEPVKSLHEQVQKLVADVTCTGHDLSCFPAGR